MRFMMLVKANEESEAGVLPTKEQIDEMDVYNDELTAAGVLVAGEGLHDSSKGFRVRYNGKGNSTVIDGPFAETKELLAGFWLINVKSRDEAIKWAQRVPFQEGELEVRQVFDVEDFAEGTVSPEIAAKEKAMRDRQENRVSSNAN